MLFFRFIAHCWHNSYPKICIHAETRDQLDLVKIFRLKTTTKTENKHRNEKRREKNIVLDIYNTKYEFQVSRHRPISVLVSFQCNSKTKKKKLTSFVRVKRVTGMHLKLKKVKYIY